jgi:hypothetical protein
MGIKQWQLKVWESAVTRLFKEKMAKMYLGVDLSGT